jgi:hypothetical protein
MSSAAANRRPYFDWTPEAEQYIPIREARERMVAILAEVRRQQEPSNFTADLPAALMSEYASLRAYVRAETLRFLAAGPWYSAPERDERVADSRSRSPLWVGREIPRPVAVSADGRSAPAVPDRPTAELLSARDLAGALGLVDRVNVVEVTLRRCAEKNPDCRVQVPNPRKGEPRYLYRVAVIWPVLLGKLDGWRLATAE